MSWACKEKAYDEFVYHWTCAIAQHDEQGQPVSSDTNGDSHVSMQEAFDYAVMHDQRPETPSLTAQPTSLTSQWTFGRLTDGINGPSDFRPPSDSDVIYDLQGKKY
jgi:hypothetical protein